MIRSLIALVALISILALQPAAAQLSSNTMLKVVVRDVTVDATSFDAMPKTLYRLGTTYGRSEEQPDPRRRLHGLVIVAEPKVWMINRISKTGRLLLDPGPSYDFHAPVIPAAAGTADNPLDGLEFGMEYDFMAAHQATSTTATVKGKTYDQLTVTRGDHEITLLSRPGTRTPFRLTVARGPAVLAEYEYDEYLTDLAPQMDLFEPPADITILDEKTAP